MLAKDNIFKDVVKDKVIQPEDALQMVGVEDGTYFLQSRSIDDVGLEGIALEPVEVKVRVNPLPPFIQSPTDGAAYRTKIVPLKWLKVAQAVKYHLQVAEDRYFNSIIEDRADITALSHQTGSLDYKTHFFRVGSIAADGYQGIWSDPLSFSIIPPPPSPPVEKPEMGDQELRIRWRDMGDGITYHFQMAQDEAFIDVLVDEKLPEPEIILAPPRDAGTYYVRTSAIDAEGYEGAFSEPQSFKVLSKYRYVPVGMLALFVLALIVF